MLRTLSLLLAVVLVLAASPALAQDTLDKIKQSGVLTIGTRTGSPPFAYVNSW
jgi:ABC-type amino acid transport substrate-binding protein